MISEANDESLPPPKGSAPLAMAPKLRGGLTRGAGAGGVAMAGESEEAGEAGAVTEDVSHERGSCEAEDAGAGVGIKTAG